MNATFKPRNTSHEFEMADAAWLSYVAGLKPAAPVTLSLDFRPVVGYRLDPTKIIVHTSATGRDLPRKQKKALRRKVCGRPTRGTAWRKLCRMMITVPHNAMIPIHEGDEGKWKQLQNL